MACLGGNFPTRMLTRAEDMLNALDVLADTDPRTGLRLDKRCARQVVGVRVGREGPFDRVAGLVRCPQHGLHRACIDRTGVVIVLYVLVRTLALI